MSFLDEHASAVADERAADRALLQLRRAAVAREVSAVESSVSWPAEAHHAASRLHRLLLGFGTHLHAEQRFADSDAPGLQNLCPAVSTISHVNASTPQVSCVVSATGREHPPIVPIKPTIEFIGGGVRNQGGMCVRAVHCLWARTAPSTRMARRGVNERHSTIMGCCSHD